MPSRFVREPKSIINCQTVVLDSVAETDMKR
jgi:hypothetical protein